MAIRLVNVLVHFLVVSVNSNSVISTETATSTTTSPTSVSLAHAPPTDTERVVHKLSSDDYNKHIRPDEKEGVPTTVYIDFLLAHLSVYSEARMDFEATLFFRQTWKDRRLVDQSRKQQVFLDHLSFQKLWVPDTFLVNEQKANLHTVTVPNRLITVDPDGTIVYSQKVTATFTCEFLLQKFPHDNQTCNIFIESYGQTADNIVYEWKNLPEVVQVPDRLTLPEYEFMGYQLKDCTKRYVTGDFSCKYVSLLMKRNIGYYVIRVFIPSALIVMLSWVSYWIDYRSVPARVSLSLLTVLTITTQATSVNARLPAVSYIKAIDVWMSVCLVFVFGGLIEYSIVNVMARSSKDKAAEKKKDDPTDVEANVKCCSATWSPSKKSEKTHLIDRWSRVAFPLMFFIFNIFYWSAYYIIIL